MPVLKYRPYVGAPWQVVGTTSAGLLPQIIVTAPTGSVVTCSKGSTVLNTEEVDGTWTFNVPEYGEWTVYSELLTASVTIDSVKQYSLELSMEQVVNYTMIYDGDLGEAGFSGANTCPSVTGGYNYNNYTLQGSGYSFSGTPSMNSDNFTAGFNTPSGNRHAQGITSINKIDLTPYTGLIGDGIFYSCIAGFGSMIGLARELSESTIDIDAYTSDDLKDSSRRLFSKDFEMSGSRYLMVKGARNYDNANYCYNTVYHLALYKEDNWGKLCSMLGVAQPENVSLFFNDKALVESLLDNSYAVFYMINQCTGNFMAAAIQSETFLTALEASPYKDLVYANEHWAKFLAMVQ